jgi:hypothetical protein
LLCVVFSSIGVWSLPNYFTHFYYIYHLASREAELNCKFREATNEWERLKREMPQQPNDTRLMELSRDREQLISRIRQAEATLDRQKTEIVLLEEERDMNAVSLLSNSCSSLISFSKTTKHNATRCSLDIHRHSSERLPFDSLGAENRA